MSFPDANPPEQRHSPVPLKLKIPSRPSAMAYGSASGAIPYGTATRRSTRNSTAASVSGSEYNDQASPVSGSPPMHSPKDEEQMGSPAVIVQSSRGRRRKLVSYAESDDTHFDDDNQYKVKVDEDEDDPPIRTTRSRSARQKNLPGLVDDEDEVEEEPDDNEEYGTRRRLRRGTSDKTTVAPPSSKPTGRMTRNSRRAMAPDAQDTSYVDEASPGSSADAEGDDDDLDLAIEMNDHRDEDDEPEEKTYALRRRARVNYAIPPPLEDMHAPPPRRPKGGRHNSKKGKGPGWSASGAELGRWMGMGADDSDSDAPTRTPRKQFGAFTGGVAANGDAGFLPPGDFAAAAASGAPSNLGKLGDSALADADPLGVNVNVTFDEVGGLDDHIHALKEMTLLPLLYPEVFQQFNVTPPRGVLFHGPPGTGKTLLARALAASCRTGGRKISFFMRKGADCLSKWVGEAERQLRLLFEEARACQPSIIFFDEIDGLAPVRSSKQDQIHASIVSTLLALMDGMDGRGQVIVIGATNRPDAIDSALRRPGRFDREFYFPLPTLPAREKILGIMTKDWRGWTGEDGQEKVKGLAKLTKGYGGADLRALCTEAALNAVQRRYPQIYKSEERLLLKPETIDVGLRDFMISVKKLVPSSARSASSSASPLPTQLVPLLEETFQKTKDVIARVLPVEKKLSALEEAEFEDYEGEEGALHREMMQQSMNTLRVYRPRMLLHGAIGMGQSYIGAAALHQLEGFHIQSLELGALMSDSTRTVEAAIVQLFVEAKRQQPSVIYIPALVGWCAAVSEASRTTVRAMLDTLAPTDPVLLIAVVDGRLSDLPADVRAWFGPTRDNRVELERPTGVQREKFFQALLDDVCRPPNHFADGMKRKKRVLEVLPIAPPIEPRAPTAAELSAQQDADARTLAILKYRLGLIMTELKRKYKRFTKRATDEYTFDEGPDPNALPDITAIIPVVEDMVVDLVDEPLESGQQHQQQAQVQVTVNGDIHQPAATTDNSSATKLYDMDLERIHTQLYKDYYLTPQDFLADIGKIVHNAHVRSHEDLDRLYRAQAMFTATEVSMTEFDTTFRVECERMASRQKQRRAERKKERQGDEPRTPAPLRRSGRNNGEAPEIAITDPSRLERRLKRQRSDGLASGSNASDDDGISRDSKRSKMEGSENGEDPLNSLPPSTVRFDVQPHSSLTPSMNGHSLNGHAVNGNPTVLPSMDMVVDPPPPPPASFAGLLNPMTPEDSPSVNLMPNGVNGHVTPQVAPSALSHSPEPVNQAMIQTPPQRTPSPPLPDFHVDENLLSQLRGSLVQNTSALNVEQLEQLRATCLGTMWRHRSEWVRDSLIRELQDLVNDFVQEVRETMAEED